jgi:hypothetical protein
MPLSATVENVLEKSVVLGIFVSGRHLMSQTMAEGPNHLIKARRLHAMVGDWRNQPCREFSVVTDCGRKPKTLDKSTVHQNLCRRLQKASLP